MKDEHYCSGHSGINSRVEVLEKSNEKAWEAIDKLRNRLPTWAVFMFMGLTTVIGYLVGKGGHL